MQAARTVAPACSCTRANTYFLKRYQHLWSFTVPPPARGRCAAPESPLIPFQRLCLGGIQISLATANVKRDVHVDSDGLGDVIITFVVYGSGVVVLEAVTGLKRAEENLVYGEFYGIYGEQRWWVKHGVTAGTDGRGSFTLRYFFS